MLRRFISDNLVQFGIRFNLLIGGFLAFLHFGLGFGFVAEAKAVKKDDAKTTAMFLYDNIITRFGCPKVLVSDRGSHFVNEMIAELTAHFKIDHRFSAPYHPQTNGQTERTNQTLCRILRKTVDNSNRDWDLKLPAALWAYRTTYKVTTHTTPFSLV